MPYHVPPDARATLRHAARLAMGSFSSSSAHLQQLRATLPPLHRVLLSTPAGCTHTGNYQEAIAGALAAELGATMLVLDSATLDALVAQVDAGKNNKDGVRGGGGGGGGVMSWLVSCVLRGGCDAFAMDSLRHACAVEAAHPAAPPMLLFVRDIDSTLAAQPERWDAFLSAFADTSCTSTSLPAHAADHHDSHSDATRLAAPQRLQPLPSPPMLMLAGTSLGDCNDVGGGGGGALPQWLEEMAWGDAEERSAEHNPRVLQAESLADSAIGGVVPRVRPVSWGGERTDVRRVLAALCAVHVRLRAPGEGAAGAAAHREALAADAEDHIATVNWLRVQAAVRAGGATTSGTLVRTFPATYALGSTLSNATDHVR